MELNIKDKIIIGGALLISTVGLIMLVIIY